MKNFIKPFIVLILLLTSTIVYNQDDKAVGKYPIEPVPFTSVKVTDNFWAPKIKINHEVTIPIANNQNLETGRIKNFELAAENKGGKFCSEYPFDDTDIYKIIEAASYSIQTNPDPALEAYLDSLIAKVAAAQEEDGYLYTIRTIQGDDSHDWIGKRWEKVHELSHELYNSGHMFEAAVAHYQATGKRNFLNVAIKNADLLDKTFGWGKLENFPGHQEVEVGLVKLYNVTGEKRYLDLAKFFLDVRGNRNGDEYNQSNKKVVEQSEAVGHAVRATYMYSAMADIAALYKDESYIQASRKIWEDVVTKKMYITGGIGASGGNEGFNGAYNLPNGSAYCETCAAVGDIMWNYRMFLYDGEAKFYNVLERILYNGFISGVSLKGDRFFYPNPLESMGQHERSKWFGCACCPPNLARLLPSLPGYIYAKTDDAIYINLFIQNTGEIDLKGNKVEIIQKTNYPWDGKVDVTVNPEVKLLFKLKIRIPGWTIDEVLPGDLYSFATKKGDQYKIKLNNEEVPFTIESGYAVIERKWKSGDQVSLEFKMEPREVLANEKVKADRDKIAIQRGPIVYTTEWPDVKDGKVLSLVFEKDQEFKTEYDPDLLNGVNIIEAKAKLARKTLKGGVEFDDEQTVKMIPYYVWNNRGSGEMMVWLPINEKSVRPLPSPTIAGTSKASGSREMKSIISINDQLLPEDSRDRTWPFYHWWPQNNSWVWVQYDFDSEKEVSSSRIYWYDDGPFGGCRIPVEWEIQYKVDDGWKAVETTSEYKVVKDDWSSVKFRPVKTTALRLRVKLPEKFSAGIHEWEVN